MDGHAEASVELGAITRNVAALRAHVAPTTVMAVVKANGYGHGAVPAAQAALRAGRIDYTSALGIPSLRERIARHYRDAYGCELSSERVIVTTGSSGGFPVAFLASFKAVVPLRKAALHFATDTAGPWQKRKWQTLQIINLR